MGAVDRRRHGRIVLSIALIALGELVARLSPQVERLLSAVHINPDWSQGITFGAVALVTVGVVTWILTRKVSVLTHNSIVLGGRVEAVVSLIDMLKQMSDQNAQEIAQLGQQAAEIKQSMGGTDETVTSHLKNYGSNLELQKSVLDVISGLAGRIYVIEQNAALRPPPTIAQVAASGLDPATDIPAPTRQSSGPRTL